jgi:limonene-1,2-epoxide hydrolase
MSADTEVVERFVAAINARDVDAIMAFFAPDAVYHNMPTEAVTGTDAVRGVIEGFVSPAESIDWEILSIAEVGSTVLTERIDRFVIGGRPVELPVMGTFELRDGRIAAWRDYFDMATWQRQTDPPTAEQG